MHASLQTSDLENATLVVFGTKEIEESWQYVCVIFRFIRTVVTKYHK